MNLRKRKNIDTIINDSKKIRYSNIINWNTMISPSNIRNYMLNDPILDWFKYYNITSINSIPRVINPSNNSGSSSFIIV